MGSNYRFCDGPWPQSVSSPANAGVENMASMRSEASGPLFRSEHWGTGSGVQGGFRPLPSSAARASWTYSPQLTIKVITDLSQQEARGHTVSKAGLQSVSSGSRSHTQRWSRVQAVPQGSGSSRAVPRPRKVPSSPPRVAEGTGVRAHLSFLSPS